MRWCYFLGSVSMCELKLESWNCLSMEGTLMPQRWEGRRGIDWFAKLQMRRFGVQEGCPHESTVKCWECVLEGQSWANRTKSWLLVGSMVSWLNCGLILFHLFVLLLISFSWLEEHQDGLFQQQWQLLLGVMAMGAFGRRMEWWVLKELLFLFCFPFLELKRDDWSWWACCLQVKVQRLWGIDWFWHWADVPWWLVLLS